MDNTKILDEKTNMSTKYQYSLTPTWIVMENPEEYIIPECLECCKLLWSKGIDTVECGNYDDALDRGFWVELDYFTLSDENKKLLEEISKSDSRVFFHSGLDYSSHSFIFRVERKDNPNASQELCDLADKLELQDTNQYSTDEDILIGYKVDGGEYELLDNGMVRHLINPDRENATLEDALKEVEHPELYIAEEGRLYKSQHALNVHKNYLNKMKNNESKRL